MSFRESFIRFLMIFFNILFLALAIAIVGIGVAVKMEWSELLQYWASLYMPYMDPVCLWSLGLLLCYVTVLGLFGAFALSKFCLVLYSITMMILVVIEIAVMSLISNGVISVDLVEDIIYTYINMMTVPALQNTGLNSINTLNSQVIVNIYGNSEVRDMVFRYLLVSVTAIVVLVQIIAGVFAQFLLSAIDHRRQHDSDQVLSAPYDPYDSEPMIDNVYYYNKQGSNVV